MKLGARIVLVFMCAAVLLMGHSGIMYCVAVNKAQKDNENIYRYAVAEACAGKAICQVQFWIG